MLQEAIEDIWRHKHHDITKFAYGSELFFQAIERLQIEDVKKIYDTKSNETLEQLSRLYKVGKQVAVCVCCAFMRMLIADCLRMRR